MKFILFPQIKHAMKDYPYNDICTTDKKFHRILENVFES